MHTTDPAPPSAPAPAPAPASEPASAPAPDPAQAPAPQTKFHHVATVLLRPARKIVPLTLREVKQILTDNHPLIQQLITKNVPLGSAPNIRLSLGGSPSLTPYTLSDPSSLGTPFDLLGTDTKAEEAKAGTPGSPYYNVQSITKQGGIRLLPACISRGTHTTVKLEISAPLEDVDGILRALLVALPSITNTVNPHRIMVKGKSCIFVGCLQLDPLPAGENSNFAFSPPFIAPVMYSNTPKETPHEVTSEFLLRNTPQVKSLVHAALAYAYKNLPSDNTSVPSSSAYFVDPARGLKNSYVIVARSQKIIDIILRLFARYNILTTRRFHDETSPLAPTEGISPCSPISPLPEVGMPFLFLDVPTGTMPATETISINRATTNQTMPDGMMLSKKEYDTTADALLRPTLDPLSSLGTEKRFLSPMATVNGVHMSSTVLVSNVLNGLRAPSNAGLSLVGNSTDYRTGRPGPLGLVTNNKQHLPLLLSVLSNITEESPMYGIFGTKPTGAQLVRDADLEEIKKANDLLWSQVAPPSALEIEIKKLIAQTRPATSGHSYASSIKTTTYPADKVKAPNSTTPTRPPHQPAMAGGRGGRGGQGGGERQNGAGRGHLDTQPKPLSLHGLPHALLGGGASRPTTHVWGGAASTASPQPPSSPRPPSAKGDGTSTEKAADAPATPLKRSREDAKKSGDTDRQAITASHGEAAYTKGSGGESSAVPSPSSTPDPKTPRKNTPPGNDSATSPRWSDEEEDAEEKGKEGTTSPRRPDDDAEEKCKDKNNRFYVLQDTEDDDDEVEKKEEQGPEKKATLPEAEPASPVQPEEAK